MVSAQGRARKALSVSMHSVIFTQFARLELIEAQEWYEAEVSGLGGRFREGIDALVDRMGKNPHQFPVVYKNVRRALLQRFPYALFFVINGDTILIISCFQASRNPLRWHDRT